MNPPEAPKKKKRTIMVWDNEKDELLVREMLLFEPHQFKPRSRERGNSWRSIAENLSASKELFFKVDARAVRERVGVIIARYHQKMIDEEAATGISPERTSLDDALEELSIKIEDAEKRHTENTDTENKVQEESKRKASEMRQLAVDSLGETKKRKPSTEETESDSSFSKENTSSKKKRSSGTETLTYLRDKAIKEQEIKSQELDLRRKELDLKKQEIEMQAQQQNRMFETMQQQNNQLLLLLVQNQNQANQ